MKTTFILLAFAFASLNLNAQKAKSAQMQEFVTNILEENRDLQAVDLIKTYYTLKDEVRNYEVDVKKSFDRRLSGYEKQEKFEKEYSRNEDYLEIKGKMNKARLAVDKYLKDYYPEYADIANNGLDKASDYPRTQPTTKKRSQMSKNERHAYKMGLRKKGR